MEGVLPPAARMRIPLARILALPSLLALVAQGKIAGGAPPPSADVSLSSRTLGSTLVKAFAAQLRGGVR